MGSTERQPAVDDLFCVSCGREVLRQCWNILNHVVVDQAVERLEKTNPIQ